MSGNHLPLRVVFTLGNEEVEIKLIHDNNKRINIYTMLNFVACWM
jgi:hypothetical protein